MQIGECGGAAGAAREENEENAAPQALPGARTRTTPQRYIRLYYVLPCSVLFCYVTEGAGEKVGKPAPRAPGELIIRHRRRRGNENSAPKAPGEKWILTPGSGEIWAKPGAQAVKARGPGPGASGVTAGTTTFCRPEKGTVPRATHWSTEHRSPGQPTGHLNTPVTGQPTGQLTTGHRSTYRSTEPQSPVNLPDN
eukprot:gene25666-biopygen15053